MEKLYRYPWIIALVIAIITVFFAFQIPRIELDNNNFRFISENDPARQVLEYIDDTFGSSVFILVAFERKTGDVFDPGFLSLVREYVERIEEVPIVGKVTSIVTADYITGDSESIVVEKLLPAEFSGTPEEIALLKERLLSWDMYKRSLISDDFSSTQVLVPLDVNSEDAGNPEVINSFILVRDYAREMFAGTAQVYVTGIPVISATINEAIRADLALLVPLVVMVVLLILFFSLRRLSGVVLPLLAVIIAAVWTMGLISVFGVKLSVISTVLPVILVAVGSAYGIHVITHYFEYCGQKTIGREEHILLIVRSVKTVAKPVLLAALTTLAGFLSFCFTTVVPIREFGFFASFGVLVSFIIALTLIPALLIIAGPPKKREKDNAALNAGKDQTSNIISRFFTEIAFHKNAVLFFSGVIIVICLAGTSKLIIDNIFIEYFKPTTDIAKSDRFVREQFGGSKIVSIVAEAENSETLLGPESLAAMDNLNKYLETKVPEVGKTMGFTDLIKRVNQVFNADESPDGIKASSASYEDADIPGIIFGFGFDDYEDDSFEVVEEKAAMVAIPEEMLNSNFSMKEFLALLSKASRSGANSEPNTNELINELKKLVNYEGAAYYEIPASPEKYGKTRPEELASLVSNYLILLSSNITEYANDPLEPTAIKTTVQLRTLGESDTNRAVDAIYSFVEEKFPGDIKVTVGGSALIETSLNRQVVNSQIISLFISLALVFFIIAFSNRSLVAGVIGIVPLSISLLINFAVMGFLGIKLNLGTSMIAGLAIGIGIDYTIHYMESFKRESRNSSFAAMTAQERRKFLERTFAVSGKAIIINALSVGAGFLVLILSNFIMLGDFGLLIALTMIVSSLVSLTVIPALMLTINPSFVYKNKGEKISQNTGE